MPFYCDFFAGGYDHVCRLWDVRIGRSTMELDHGAPVEDVLFLPSGVWSMCFIYISSAPYQMLHIWKQKTVAQENRKFGSLMSLILGNPSTSC